MMYITILVALKKADAKIKGKINLKIYKQGL